MLSSEIIRRMIEEKMKNSNECQPSLIQQDLQFLNSTRSKTLKILKSRVFARSTVSSYSSDLLKNTHQYRIINNSGLGDVLGMNQTTQISYNSSPEYSSLLFFKTAVEKQYTSKQVISTSVSTGTQTLSSESFETGTQTLSNYAEAASQTNTEMTLGVSPSTFMASIQTSSSADIKTTALADENVATRSTVQCIDDRDPTDKRQQKMITDFERFKETLDDIHESLKTSMDLLKQEVDRFVKSVEYIRTSSVLSDTVNSEYRSANRYTESSYRASEFSSPDIFRSAGSLYAHNTQDTEDLYSAKEYFYDQITAESYDKSETSTPEYFYSYADSSSASSGDNGKSEYASFSSPYEFDSPSEQYYSVENDSLVSAQDTRSSENNFLAASKDISSVSSGNNGKSKYASFSSPYEFASPSEQYYSVENDSYFSVQDTRSSENNFLATSKDISSASSSDNGKSEYASFSSPYEFDSPSEQYYSVENDSLVSAQDTRSSENNFLAASKDISSVSSGNNGKSKYASFSSPYEFASPSEQYYSVENDSYFSVQDTRSSENNFLAASKDISSVSSGNNGKSEYASFSSPYEFDSPSEQYYSVGNDFFLSAQDTRSSENNFLATSKDISIASSGNNGKSEYASFSSPYEFASQSEQYYSVENDSLVSAQDTRSSENNFLELVTKEHSMSMNNTDLQEQRSSGHNNMDISEHEIILSEQAIVHVQDNNSSKYYTPNAHGTSEHHDVPEQEFDIRNMVTWNSFGDKVFDYSTMLSMYGFDPRKSPFVHCGYLRMDTLPDDFDDLELQDIKRRDVKYQKNENGSYNEIGRGTYGVVYLATMKNIQNKVVVKKIHNQGVSWEKVEQEAKILTYLQGQDITPNFLGVLAPRKKSQSYSLVQEYYGHGTVEDVFLNYELSPYAWIMICRNICRVLFEIHSNHILFNDLKSDNILVNLDNFDIRFIDFGMATFRQGVMFNNSKSLHKCLFYGPEVREGCFSTPQSDIYSLGFLFKQIIKYGSIVELYPLYKACTAVKAIDRPSLPEIIEILDTMLNI